MGREALGSGGETRLVVVDTSVVIGFLRAHEPAVAWLSAALRARRAALTAVTACELELGVVPGSSRQGDLHRLLAHLPVLPFDAQAAMLAAQVERLLRTEGRCIGPADVLIAGICLARSLPLATDDRDHFGRVPGLTVIPV